MFILINYHIKNKGLKINADYDAIIQISIVTVMSNLVCSNGFLVGTRDALITLPALNLLLSQTMRTSKRTQSWPILPGSIREQWSSESESEEKSRCNIRESKGINQK